jgi:hypothetical protein
MFIYKEKQQQMYCTVHVYSKWGDIVHRAHISGRQTLGLTGGSPPPPPQCYVTKYHVFCVHLIVLKYCFAPEKIILLFTV